jgi:ATP-dependent Lon protease
MLDEIDKVGADYRGDPSSALLEALDPEQNGQFSDHYLEVPFDLSNVMFITTANVLDTIPPALRDRLEIIHFAGYTQEEKFKIVRNFLMKKQIENHGLSDEKVEITDEAIQFMINHYTREAGVRNLERKLATVLRKIAKKVAEGETGKIVVKAIDIPKYLGPIRFSATMIEKQDEVGMSTGLAWTEAGGDILFIEVALMPGRGHLTLTGQLGDVMKESAQAALSYIRSRASDLGIPDKVFQKTDIHVHVPEGAIPKDGPSAGIAITTAITSALTKIPVSRKVGMTGEVTLRGRVMEIGGLKEKVIAAHRAGLKTIIIPKDNKKDLEDIPKEVLNDLKFKPVTNVDEVLEIALTKPLQRSQKQPVEKIHPASMPVLHAEKPY